MAKIIEISRITPTNGLYDVHKRAQEAVNKGVRVALTQSKVRLLIAGGDSNGFGFTFYCNTEEALKNAAESGEIDRIVSISFSELGSQFDLNPDATVEFCFSSDEYVETHGDGYARWHDGDWRTDYAITLNSKGIAKSHAQNH